MKKVEKKPALKRILLGMAQHLAMAFATLVVIVVFHNSIIRLDNVQEENRQYRLDPFDNAQSFEETEIFGEMFYNVVSDLTTLVVLKSQFETDGVYDGKKVIDVTEFVNRREQVSDSAVTARYYLDDLVKWGKAEIEMQPVQMTKEAFVDYFQDGLLDLDHFYLEADTDVLRYSGDVIGEEERMERAMATLPADSGVDGQDEDYLRSYLALQMDHLQEIYNNYKQYNEEQLVEMAFSYAASHMDKPIELVTVKGEEMVELEMLKERYLTADGQVGLQEAAGNWIDYCKLENNVVETLESLAQNYDIYMKRNDLYAEGNTNIRYLFRIPGEGGIKEFKNFDLNFPLEDTSEIDRYFQDIGSYLIYSVEDIICESNVPITDNDMYLMVETHDYAYPPGSMIWIGLPDEYQVEGDQFAMGRQVFEQIVVHIGGYAVTFGVCLAIWAILFVYLTFGAGYVVKADGELGVKINFFDRLYTEFVLLLTVGCAYLGVKGMNLLLDILADGYYQTSTYLSVLSEPLEWSIYAIGALYGFLASFTFCVIWYSFVRRLRYGNLWDDSFLHWLCLKFYKAISMVLYHKNVAVRTLLPYNLFLLANLAGFVCAFQLRAAAWVPLAVVLGILVFDAMVGVFLFRNNAEMGEIVEAIRRVRGGETEYRVDTEKLHGENKEIAEAVNNIGEGIRNAVETSVKDEMLKSDLITNVSHDIKTPLTSIINYVDLLKREKITQEPARSYINILENKTQRLKQLTDDLVEASKISSGNIVLQKERLDLAELLNQAFGEFSEKLEEQRLTVVFGRSDKEAFIYADSRRMWRVVENLFNNICKYAMPDTRVYVDLRKADGVVCLAVKNVSRQQLSIRPEELSERFIRGDESRTTEGSGLGLSIAKNLIELQGGSFRIAMDGDLFKVLIEFPEQKEEVE